MVIYLDKRRDEMTVIEREIVRMIVGYYWVKRPDVVQEIEVGMLKKQPDHKLISNKVIMKIANVFIVVFC
jgi:hypothetical protein